MSERWATFDCYGTLVDWNGGIGGELARLWPDEDADRLLERYHEIEPRVELEGLASVPRGSAPVARSCSPRARASSFPPARSPRWATRCRAGRSSRRCPARSPSCASGAGGSCRFRTPTPTSSTPRWRRSACRSTARSSRARSAPTSPHTGTGRRSTSASTPTPSATSMWPRASSTTSRPRDELGIPAVWINRLDETSDLPRRGGAARSLAPSRHGGRARPGRSGLPVAWGRCRAFGPAAPTARR